MTSSKGTEKVKENDFLTQTVTSKNNPTVMMLSSLSEKKYREKYKMFLAEGWKLTEEAVLSELPIEKIVLSEEKSDFYLAELRRLWKEKRKAADKKPDILILSIGCFEKISTEKAPQGVISAVRYLDFFKSFDTMEREHLKENAKAVFLCGVRDPGNLGSVIRSAAAFGADTVICSEDCADIYHPKTVRSAMGNLFRMNVLRVKSAEQAVLALKSMGRRVYAAELTERALSLSALPLQTSDVFVIGNEGHGIQTSVSDLCSQSVFIPIAAGVDSLNASVAASILLYEQFGRNSLPKKRTEE